MTLDHLREIALIQISQAQRTNAMTFKKASFQITTIGEGVKNVEGFVCGFFGVHKTPAGKWSVTHTPSGMSITVLNRPTLAETKRAVAEAIRRWKWQGDTLAAICEDNAIDGRALKTELFNLCR